MICAFAAIALVATGCGAGQPAADADQVDLLPRLTVTEELRIGDLDDPDLGFSRLAAAAVDDDGNVYALEAQALEIRVFSPDGRLLRRFGRRGQGPGEFQSGPLFGVVGDTLWAYDIAARRITLFDRTGQVLSTAFSGGTQILLANGFGFVTPWRMRADGLFSGWLAGVAIPSDGGLPDRDPDVVVPIPHLVFNAAGEVVDTVGWLSSPPPRTVPPPGFGRDRYRQITVGAGRYYVPDPPPSLPFWDPVEDGHIEVEFPVPDDAGSAVVAITRLGLAGDTVYRTVLRYRPERFESECLDSIAARTARGSGFSPAAPESDQRVVANALRAAMKFPRFKPPLEITWIADDDGVWLAWEGGDDPERRWILVGPDGRLRGELRLSRKVFPLWSRGEILWASVLDEFNVPWLVRYRIEGDQT